MVATEARSRIKRAWTHERKLPFPPSTVPLACPAIRKRPATAETSMSRLAAVSTVKPPTLMDFARCQSLSDVRERRDKGKVRYFSSYVRNVSHCRLVRSKCHTTSRSLWAFGAFRDLLGQGR